MTLAQADSVIDAVLHAGRIAELKPLSVAIVDSGGHLIAFKRANGSSFFRFELAFGKAYAAAAFAFPTTGQLQKFFESRPLFASYSQQASHGKMLVDAGGVRILDNQGNCIGAVGVTGDVSVKDEQCAIAGILAAGLIPAAHAP